MGIGRDDRHRRERRADSSTLADAAPAAALEGSPGRLEWRRRCLELELKRIRSQASAARLEARAAEIELMLRRLETTRPGDSIASPDERGDASSATSREPATGDFVGLTPVDFTGSHQPWKFENETSLAEIPGTLRSSDPTRSQPGESAVRAERAAEVPPDPTPLPPLGGSSTALEDEPKNDANGSETEAALPSTELTAKKTTNDRRGPRRRLSTNHPSPPPDDPTPGRPLEALGGDAVAASKTRPLPSSTPLAEPSLASLDAETAPERPREHSRTKPLLVSSVLHLMVLIVFATWTLSTHPPKDQIALAASTTVSDELTVETFTFETTEPEAQANDTLSTEAPLEVSALGDVAVTEVSPMALPPTPLMSVDEMFPASASSVALADVQSDPRARTEFCGVEGGGNHFAYLVDSSGSMKEGFDSARQELLRAIDQLQPDQRFYVVFFDAEPDYMRLTDATEDEPRSVYATEENKQALRRWAMGIRQDRGRAPYEPLEFVLQLRPDVIFLLSDGEFPQRIESMLQELNQVENLFGETHPRSLVHTIAYFSEEGESRMRRIAEQNGGQYRYVPRQ